MLPSTLNPEGRQPTASSHATATGANLDDALPKAQKAAIVLASLNIEIASQIVKGLSDAELQVFAKAFADLRAVSAVSLNAVVAEFSDSLARRKGELRAGADEARLLLAKLTDESRLSRLFEDAPDKDGIDIWQKIEGAPDEALAGFIARQKPPAAAAILATLSPEKSAAVIGYLEDDIAEAAFLELARRPSFPKEVIAALATAIDEEVIAPLSKRPNYSLGGASVGEILNYLNSQRRNDFLSRLQSADGIIATAVKKVVLTFDELPSRLPGVAVAIVLRALDRKTALTALKYGQGCSGEAVDFVFSNLSKRMGEEMREEIAELPEFSEEMGENALRALMMAVRRLESAGDIKLLDPPKEES